MLQRLAIALVQVKTGNISEDLLNEIHQITHVSCIEQKKIIYNNIMNALCNIMYTIMYT